MKNKNSGLTKNLILTGVGGQGNVMASRALAGMLVDAGYVVTIGETFGMSQRGGSVMSHLRISPDAVKSPQIPKGGADVMIRGDAAGQITATDWAQMVEPFAERALDILERCAPGMRGKILESRIVSPTDLEAENPNLVGCDQIGGSHRLAQHFLFRPAHGHADGATALKNLYLTGASVWPGAGTGAGPGWLLAQRLAAK